MPNTTTRFNSANGEALPVLADDMMRGGKAIAVFIFGNDDDKNVRRVYHAAAHLGLPTFTLGSTICGRQSTILRWIAEQEARS